jgi:hypothetical protein
MTTRHLELHEELYEKLRQAADTEGVSPEEWIQARLPSSTTATGERSLSEALKGLVGSFDSSQEQYGNRQVSPMAEMVADKLQKQGIEVPWRQQR